MEPRARAAPMASQTRAKTNGLATLITVKPVSASPTAWVWPVTFTTASPNSAGSTRLSAGYTVETAPSVSPR